MSTEMLSWVKEYFENTPEPQIQKDWKEIRKMGIGGPTIREYMPYFKGHYCRLESKICRQQEMKVPDNMTSNYNSGSFF